MPYREYSLDWLNALKYLLAQTILIYAYALPSLIDENHTCLIRQKLTVQLDGK
jgi:hypothetical protein